MVIFVLKELLMTLSVSLAFVIFVFLVIAFLGYEVISHCGFGLCFSDNVELIPVLIAICIPSL